MAGLYENPGGRLRLDVTDDGVELLLDEDGEELLLDEEVDEDDVDELLDEYDDVDELLDVEDELLDVEELVREDDEEVDEYEVFELLEDEEPDHEDELLDVEDETTDEEVKPLPADQPLLYVTCPVEGLYEKLEGRLLSIPCAIDVGVELFELLLVVINIYAH